MKRTFFLPVLPLVLLSLIAGAALLLISGRAASVSAQVGAGPEPAPRITESAGGVLDAPAPMASEFLAVQVPAFGRQVVFQMLIVELDPERMRDNDFDLAKELGVEPAPQPDPVTKAPLVARLQPREWRLLSRSLTLAGMGEVLSRPTVVTLAGQPAKIHVGEEIPLLAIEQTVNGKREDRLDSRAFGTTVELTPRFTAARTLRLEWNAETSRLLRDGEKLPRLLARTLRGAASCELGETLVIADVPAIAAAGPTEAGLLVAMTAEEAAVGLLPGAPSSAEAPTFFDGVAPQLAGSAAAHEETAPALPRRDEPANLPADIRLIELPLEGEGGEEAVRGISPGDRIRLFGRERLDDGGLGEEAHDVLENVAVRRVFVVDGRATLLLQLAPRDADKLKLAREHCQIRIEVEAKPGEPLDLLGDTTGPETRSSNPLAAEATDPTAAGSSEEGGEYGEGTSGTGAVGEYGKRRPVTGAIPPSAPTAPTSNRPPAPLREELQSLRDEVRGLRHDIDRVIELLERRQESGMRGAGQQFRTNPARTGGDELAR